MSNTIKITKEIPAPPEGFAVEDRQPKEGEEAVVLSPRLNDWEGPEIAYSDGWCKPLFKNCIYAYRIPKKKRLMTPQELAGKWVWRGGAGATVCGIDIQEGKIYTHKTSLTVFEAKLNGWSWSDTPTSEPHSLEVDDDR